MQTEASLPNNALVLDLSSVSRLRPSVSVVGTRPPDPTQRRARSRTQAAPRRGACTAASPNARWERGSTRRPISGRPTAPLQSKRSALGRPRPWSWGIFRQRLHPNHVSPSTRAWLPRFATEPPRRGRESPAVSRAVSRGPEPRPARCPRWLAARLRTKRNRGCRLFARRKHGAEIRSGTWCGTRRPKGSDLDLGAHRPRSFVASILGRAQPLLPYAPSRQHEKRNALDARRNQCGRTDDT